MTIKNLVRKYRNNRAVYLKATYNEMQVRVDFLDPLFELLGWDIPNKQARPTYEREVLLEESLKADAFSHSKKPDYTFRLFSERKFFVEAKKPSLEIERHGEAAQQIRRYGFTAKLKISVLSNFEYLAIYDCSQKVGLEDSASQGRIKLYHYTEYEAAFEEIKQLLGQIAVYNGQFDENWREIENKIQLVSVDRLFLNQINDWRLLLGQEIYSHNTKLRIEELNDIVQSYINSIIFLRVCEDRNLEAYKTLLDFASQEDFTSLIVAFKKADKKYNANLFRHSLSKEIISNNSSVFWTIIKQLYFPESVYSFSVFASDILGNIYEVFLGEQLELEAGTIRLVKKPENIDRDIVTTPTTIIRDILRHTVVKYCEGKTDQQILSYSFADIACGSGAFLLETYQLLQNILVDYYLVHKSEELIQTAVNTFKLSFRIKKQILKNCIFGVDKDYNAVQACKFGLLLKLLEDEKNETISRPALPNLDQNIHFGNSLIDSSSINADADRNIVNPFDFNVKFDVVIGNPPYMATADMKTYTPLEYPLYKAHFVSAYKQFDKYFLFIEKGLALLKPEGYLGYIVPSKFTKVGAAKKLRELLQTERSVQRIISFGAHQIFHNKTTYSCLLILKKNKNKNLAFFEIDNFIKWNIQDVELSDFDAIPYEELNMDGWVLVSKKLKLFYDAISKQSLTLEDIVGSGNIYNGIQTSANNVYIHTSTSESTDYIHFTEGELNWKIEKTLTRPYFKTVSGTSGLNSYRPFQPNSFVIYPYLKTNQEIKFVEIERMKSDFPKTFAYLKHHQKKLKSRDIKPKPATDDEWYRYGRHQSLDKCDVPEKIVVGVLSQGNKYAIDHQQTLISSGGTAGYCIITLPENCPYSIYYIQAILNSKYLEWISSLMGEIFRGGYIARGTKVLNRLPIRVIDFENPKERVLHKKIATFQKSLIKIQAQIDLNPNNNRAKTPLRRQFESKKAELNQYLKTLYDLGVSDHLIPLISQIYAAD